MIFDDDSIHSTFSTRDRTSLHAHVYISRCVLSPSMQEHKNGNLFKGIRPTGRLQRDKSNLCIIYHLQAGRRRWTTCRAVLPSAVNICRRSQMICQDRSSNLLDPLLCSLSIFVQTLCTLRHAISSSTRRLDSMKYCFRSSKSRWLPCNKPRL